MAKGSYRRKRLRVLEELREHDPVWADQLDAMRSDDPQSYRKQMLKVDAWLSAKLGRPTTLSMRRKRFGGDEDPVLVRRVQELRRTLPELTRGYEHVPVIGGPTPPAQIPDVGPAEDWVQRPTPENETPDVGPADGWFQHHTPGLSGDLPAAAGHRIPAQPPQRQPDDDLDLSVLDGNIASIKKQLATGAFDEALDAVEAAERAGKSRTGVLAAIAGRRSH